MSFSHDNWVILFFIFKQKDPFKIFIHQKEHNRMKKLQKIFKEVFQKDFWKFGHS
jgi:hypothetical protein